MVRHAHNTKSVQFYMVPVAKGLDNAIHWINHCPVESAAWFSKTYPMDGDLSDGKPLSL